MIDNIICNNSTCAYNCRGVCVATTVKIDRTGSCMTYENSELYNELYSEVERLERYD